MGFGGEVLKEFLVGISVAYDKGVLEEYEKQVAKTTGRVDERLEKMAQAAAKRQAARIKAEEKETKDRAAAAEKTAKEEERRLRDRAAAHERFTRRAVVQANLLTDAMETGLKAAIRYVDNMAIGFERVFYASQKMGSSATNIRSLVYGLSQAGTTADAANQSLENFARTLRNNRGHYEVLERLGVKTKDASGAYRDPTALVQEFGKALRSQNQEAKHLYLDMFGIDEDTGRALLQGVEKFSQEYRDKLKAAGLDPDEADKKGAALAKVFRSLTNSLDIIGQKVASKLFDSQNNTFQRFIEFLDKNGDKIADTIAKLVDVTLKLVEALVKLATSDAATAFLNRILGLFGEVDKKTGEFTASVDKLKLALEALAVLVAGSFLVRMLGAFGMLGGGWAKLLAAFGIRVAGPAALGAVAMGHGFQTPEQYQESLRADPEAKKFDDEKKAGAAARNGFTAEQYDRSKDDRSLWQKLAPKFLGGKEAPVKPEAGAATPGAQAPQGDGTGTRGAASTGDMMRYAMDQLRREGVPEEHLRQAAAHLVGQAHMESGLDPNKNHDPKNGVYTGYGIYGARDPTPGRGRKTDMLNWLRANGYAPNSAEGQMRYMAREAMSGRYPVTKRILMGQGTGNVETDTNTITNDFERPEITNRRSPAVSNAMRIGPSEAPVAPAAPPAPKMPGPGPQILLPESMGGPKGGVGGAKPGGVEIIRPPGGGPAIIKGAPPAEGKGLTDEHINSGAVKGWNDAINAERAKDRKSKITPDDIMPGGLKGAVGDGPLNLHLPDASKLPLPPGRQSNVTIDNRGDIKVTGMSDGRQIAERIDRVRGYRNSDLLRNMRSAIG